MTKIDGHFRINLFLVITGVFFGLIFYRLSVLSYVKHSIYARTAEAQIEHIGNILTRGNIYLSDRGGTTILAATNKKFAVLGIVPAKIPSQDINEIITNLQQITNIDGAVIAKAIQSGSSNYKTIARQLTPEQVTRINDLNYKGVTISYEMDRYYPNASLAADVLGFLGYSGNNRAGQYGIEASYDMPLFGKKDASSVQASTARSLWVFGKSSEVIRPNDVILTIDTTIQKHVEEQLDLLIKKWGAVAGAAIIQEPKTGKILAMVDRPSFDPNTYSTSTPNVFLNSNIQEIFEPGSSFKPITIAAGLDLGKISPTTTYEDKGSIVIDGYKIKNFSENVFGFSTMSQVLEKSINTGAMFVENLIGDTNFTNYVINMGFGQRTGIDLPGEVNGDVANLYSGRKINYLTASFGQGVAVTPLQLINAYSTIANGGKLMRPYVVERVVSEGGKEEITQPEIVGIPISDKTSAKLTSMLVNVVQKGFDKAKINGYDIAGKTGTAQIPNDKGGYLENEYIHNFVGFAPANDPKFTILIKIDKPHGITFAADSISPTFREITQFLFQYYSIPPSHP